MKIVSLPVQLFAMPVPRVGSIEQHSGYGRGALDGQEIHLRVQQKRTRQDETYRAEVPVQAEFARGEYLFRIGGRMDGYFPGKSPKVEEIKSAFNLFDLKKRLLRQDDHPYCLQLKTYGYFHWLEHKIIPTLSFHLVSSRNWTSEDVDIKLDIADYEVWLERRLVELGEEAQRSEFRAARRQKIAGNFAFPFERPRTGQVDLIAAVETAMSEKRRLLIQAPTGLGKTVGVLYPVLKEALGRGQRAIYVTPKNSQHSVAEDAIERFNQNGAKVKALTLTAKSKICFKNEPLCNPDYCEYAKDYYTKVYDHRLGEVLARKRKLNRKLFRELGEQYQVCPFELQMEAAQEVDVVICDYNYVFAPRTAFGRMDATSLGQTGKANLVVDEAHNLPARAMDYYSPSLSTFVLEKMRPAAQLLPTTFRAEVDGLITECIEAVKTCRPEGATKATLIDPPAELFLEQDGHLRTFLSRYLDSDVEIQPRDVVLRLAFYWSEFTAALDFVANPKRPEFFTSFQPDYGGKGGTVRITCCDASEMLKDAYDGFDQVVAFSATLKPFEYYAELSGLEPEQFKVAEFQSPFPKERRKLVIIPEISTKYSDRERSYPKIAEVIARVSAVRKGNYFAFFPSFEFLTRVLNVFRPPDGFTVLRQEKEMRANDVQSVIDHLRLRIAPTIVFAVQGGVFSEGVDYPDETIIGAYIVGPPLPVFDLEREQMREYYQQNYGAGFDYAYTYPAMAKAVQAAGRVIRSETDRGLIVLMDSRFVTPNYARTMPTDWFAENPRELVSKSILKDISDFWG